MIDLSRLPAVLVPLLAANLAHAEDWPQWRGPQRDGVWRENGIIERFEAPEIKVKWRVPIAGGYSGPTVEQVWEDRTAVPPNRFATIHLVRHGERSWMFNERGELIIARLTPEGFQEISRAKLIEPTTDQLRRRDGVTWSHPAFAYRHVFARNDKALVCADLSADQPQSSDTTRSPGESRP